MGLKFKILIIIIFPLVSIYCIGKAGNKSNHVDPIIIGNYLDTTFKSGRISIDYRSDSSILISIKDSTYRIPLVISRSELPEWFDPTGFDRVIGFTVEKIDGEIIHWAKYSLIGDTIIFFPIYSVDHLVDICVIKIDNKGNPNLVLDGVPLPTQKLFPSPHMNAYFNEKYMQIAYSEFFPTPQSVRWWKVVAFNSYDPFIIGVKEITKEDCPCDVFINDPDFEDCLRCTFSKIFEE
jgi:hypothetical protein